jgi:hypothetical protein
MISASSTINGRLGAVTLLDSESGGSASRAGRRLGARCSLRPSRHDDVDETASATPRTRRYRASDVGLSSGRARDRDRTAAVARMGALAGALGATYASPSLSPRRPEQWLPVRPVSGCSSELGAAAVDCPTHQRDPIVAIRPGSAENSDSCQRSPGSATQRVGRRSPWSCSACWPESSSASPGGWLLVVSLTP